MKLVPVLFYIGPDVLMPVASALAAVVGFLLMFWRRVASVARAAGQKIAGLFGRK